MSPVHACLLALERLYRRSPRRYQALTYPQRASTHPPQGPWSLRRRWYPFQRSCEPSVISTGVTNTFFHNVAAFRLWSCTLSYGAGGRMWPAQLVGMMTPIDVALFILFLPRVLRRNTSLHCALFIVIHRGVLVCVVDSCNVSTRPCLAPSPCRLCNTLFTQTGADASNSVPLCVGPPLKVVRPGRVGSRRAERERSRVDCPYAGPGCRMYVQFRAQGAARSLLQLLPSSLAA